MSHESFQMFESYSLSYMDRLSCSSQRRPWELSCEVPKDRSHLENLRLQLVLHLLILLLDPSHLAVDWNMASLPRALLFTSRVLLHVLHSKNEEKKKQNTLMRRPPYLNLLWVSFIYILNKSGWRKGGHGLHVRRKGRGVGKIFMLFWSVGDGSFWNVGERNSAAPPSFIFFLKKHRHKL